MKCFIAVLETKICTNTKPCRYLHLCHHKKGIKMVPNGTLYQRAGHAKGVITRTSKAGDSRYHTGNGHVLEVEIDDLVQLNADDFARYEHYEKMISKVGHQADIYKNKSLESNNTKTK